MKTLKKALIMTDDSSVCFNGTSIKTFTFQAERHFLAGYFPAQFHCHDPVGLTN